MTDRHPRRDAGAYPRPPLPPDEPQRMEALRAYDILDTPPDQGFDDLTLIAAQICDTPIALVSLIDTDRQWFKSRVGLDIPETPRDMAFCAHAIAAPGTMVVPDALADERFAWNPLVVGDPQIRFYAGAPLRIPGGHALGTLCVIDREPRELKPDQQRALEALARQAGSLLELRRKANELKVLSNRDALTGVFNRGYLDRILPAELSRAGRYDYSTSVLLLDLDRFKQVNDAYGHAEGDRVLTLMASTLRKAVRAADTVCRYGGEEFAAVLPHTGLGVAAGLAQRIRTAVATTFREANPPLESGGTTVTIGVAAFPDDARDAASLLAAADHRLYAGKKGGRDRVVAADS